MKLLVLHWPLQNGVGRPRLLSAQSGRAGGRGSILLVHGGPGANRGRPRGRRGRGRFGLFGQLGRCYCLPIMRHFLGTMSIVNQRMGLQMLHTRSEFAGLGLSNDDPSDRYVIFDF